MPLAFPVDKDCLFVCEKYAIIGTPMNAQDVRSAVRQIKYLVQAHFPDDVEHWQRLHALVQLERVSVRSNARGSPKGL
jgi:hypothetical protein